MEHKQELLAFGGRYTFVSPIPSEHLSAVWHWLREFSRQMVNDDTPKTFESMVKKHDHDIACGGKSYIILSGDMRSRPVGAVWGELMGDEVYLAHLVFDRYSLSTHEKLALAKAAVSRLFADGARKLSWAMYADNRAFRLFLVRMGASYEGTFRRATRRNGELIDVLWMATFAEDMQ